MAVISIRLNTEEEKMVRYLSHYFDEEKSSLIKHSLKEMYEDTIDKEKIGEFEKGEKKKKPQFISSSEAIKSLGN